MNLGIRLTDKQSVEVVEKNITNNLQNMCREAGLQCSI